MAGYLAWRPKRELEIRASAKLSKFPIVLIMFLGRKEVFPLPGNWGADLRQVDLRKTNSWRTKTRRNWKTTGNVESTIGKECRSALLYGANRLAELNEKGEHRTKNISI